MICRNPRRPLGQIFKTALEPLLLELCVISHLGVFGYVEESISDVNFSVQGQDQMLRIK